MSASAPDAPNPRAESAGAMYVTLTSGEVIELSPATNAGIDPEYVIIYNGLETVASYSRSTVFSCSKTQSSPALT